MSFYDVTQPEKGVLDTTAVCLQVLTRGVPGSVKPRPGPDDCPLSTPERPLGPSRERSVRTEKAAKLRAVNSSRRRQAVADAQPQSTRAVMLVSRSLCRVDCRHFGEATRRKVCLPDYSQEEGRNETEDTRSYRFSVSRGR
jgi:hypothetical protein